nr:hypothetical protein [Methanosarcina barkeri]
MSRRFNCLAASGDVASIIVVSRVNFNGSFSSAFSIASLLPDDSSEKSS